MHPSRRAAFAVLALQASACTSQATLSNLDPFVSAARHDSFLRLRDQEGRAVHLEPTTKVRIVRRDHEMTEWVAAGALCRNVDGLYARADEGSCEAAMLLAAWDNIERVDVEGFDGASTTLLIAAGVVVVVGAVAMLASSTKKEKSDEDTRSGSDSPDPPKSRVESARRSSSEAVLSEVAMRAIARGVVSAAQSQPPNERSQDAFHLTEVREPIFSDEEVRRAKWSPLVSLDIGACVYRLDDPLRCTTGSARVGMRFANYVEITAGARSLYGFGSGDRVGRWAPTFGIGLHGTIPRARNWAFAFTTEVGVSGSLPLVFTMKPEIRFQIEPRTWLGLVPVAPTFVLGDSSRPHGWHASTLLQATWNF